MDFANDDLLDTELEEDLGPLTDYTDQSLNEEEVENLLLEDPAVKAEDEWHEQSPVKEGTEWFQEEVKTEISITGEVIPEDVLDIDIKDQELETSDIKEEPEIIAVTEEHKEENEIVLKQEAYAESETDDVQEDEEPSERGKFIVERPSPVQNDASFLPRKRTKFMPGANQNLNREYVNQNIRPPFINRNRPHFNSRNGPINNFPTRPQNVNNCDIRFHNNMRPQFRPPFNSIRPNVPNFVQNPPFLPRGHQHQPFFRGPITFPQQNQNMPMNAPTHFRPNGSNFNNPFPPPGSQGFRQPFPMHPPGNVEQFTNQHYHAPPPRANGQFMDNITKIGHMPNSRNFVPLSINNPQHQPLHNHISEVPSMQTMGMINNFNNSGVVHRGAAPIMGYENEGNITRTIPNTQQLMKKSEQRTVLINPHFKGKVPVQNARLIWDLQNPHLNVHESSLTYTRTSSYNNEDDLLRQQEEFINQNRRNLQKRMSQQQQYERDSPDHGPRRPSPHRHVKTFTVNRNRNNDGGGRYDSRKRFANKRNEAAADSNNHNVVTQEPEDDETKEYRLKIEDQKRLREKYLRDKEERRKLRQAEESANLNNSENERMETNEIISSSSDVVMEQPEVINDRLAKINKGVQKTGIINLKTGKITQKKIINVNKSDQEIRIPNASHTSKTIVTNPKTIRTTNSIAISVATMTEDNNLQGKASSMGSNKSSGSENVNITRTVNIRPTGQTVICTSLNNMPQHSSASNQSLCKSGFLGRRMVIASNTDKSHIIVKATHLIENKSTNTGIFRKIIANQVEDEA